MAITTHGGKTDAADKPEPQGLLGPATCSAAFSYLVGESFVCKEAYVSNATGSMWMDGGVPYV